MEPDGAQGRTRTGTTLRSGDFKSPAATNYATRAMTNRAGGGGRNRTGVHGFAGRCMTTLPPRPAKTKRESGPGDPPSLEIWSGKRVSNSRPQPWQGCALPTELFPRFVREIIVTRPPAGNYGRRHNSGSATLR